MFTGITDGTRKVAKGSFGVECFEGEFGIVRSNPEMADLKEWPGH